MNFNKDFLEPTNLHQMSDQDYLTFTNAYTEHHQKNFPNSCLYLPRRKTPEEREQEEREITQFAAEHGLDFED